VIFLDEPIESELLGCINTPGQSGFEKPIREFLIRKLSSYGEISQDKLGSVICHIPGKSTELKCFISAHMDTCGFLVHSINGNGQIKCVNFGYQNTSACHLQPVGISTSKGLVKGLMNAQSTNKQASFTIDVGLRSAKDVIDLGIKAGDPVHFTNEPVLIGNPSRKIICSPRLDNRLGVFELLLLAKQFGQPQYDVYLVGTVEEEVGARGAKTSAEKVKPDLAIILDATYDEHPVAMGNGPVITLSDRAVIINSKVRDHLINLAKKRSIPIQTEVWNIGGTDAGPIRTIGEGIPTIPILTATKNNHTPSELGSIHDCYSVAKFSKILIENSTDILNLFHD
jgi:endoglucanase